MDGIHDLGGKHGFGRARPAASGEAKDSNNTKDPGTTEDPREAEDSINAFQAYWEARVFNMMRELRRAGIIRNADQFRHAIERIDPRAYLLHGYYGRWLGGLETLVVEAGIVSQAIIDERALALGAPADALIAARPARSTHTPSAGTVSTSHSANSHHRVTAARQALTPAKFKPGDWVRTVPTGTPGHTRLPAYVRAKSGRILSAHNAWVYPDTNAHGCGENPQHLYTVSFTGDELWGASAQADCTLNIDLFEPYLEAL